MAKQKRRSAIYVRISSDRKDSLSGERQGLGIKRQEEDCRALVNDRGWALDEDHVYRENDKSAFNGKNRPEWNRLLADADGGAFNTLVAWHDDRLWRDVTEQQLVFQILRDRGVDLIVAGGREYRTASVDDNVLSGIQALFAQKESADKSRRLRRKALENAKAGRLNGKGCRPLGFEDDFLTVREDEAALIREAAERALRGEPLGRIARDWNVKGLRTTQGRYFQGQTIRRVLTSARVCGWREHQGKLVAPAVWPAIIDRDVWDKLQSRLRDPSRATGKQAQFLLSGGLIVCGTCGANMAGQRRSYEKLNSDGVMERVRYYACLKRDGRASCGSISREAESLETWVRDAVFEALDSPKLERAIRAQTREDSREADLLRSLRKDEEALEQVAKDHYVDALIGRTEFLAARQSLDARLEHTKAMLGRLERGTLLADIPSGRTALETAWDEHGLDWRRALLRTVVDKVLVRPAVRGRSRFDEDQIEVVWRA